MAAFRYWRLFIQAVNNPVDYCSIIEIELHASVGGPDVTSPSTPVTASSFFSGQIPSNTVDNGTNQWSTALQNVSAANPCWLVFDLGTPQSIVEFSITGPPAGFSSRGPKIFALQASDDGVTWPVFAQRVADQVNWSASQTRVFPVTISYVGGNAKLDSGTRADLVRVIAWDSPYGVIGNMVPATNGDWKMMVDVPRVLAVICGPSGYQPVAHGPIDAVT
jgi:PKD repeat protein